MICKKCGNDNQEGMRYCTKCGAMLIAPNFNNAQNNNQNVSKNNNGNQNAMLGIIIALVSILIVGVIVVGVVLINNNNKNTTTSENTKTYEQDNENTNEKVEDDFANDTDTKSSSNNSKKNEFSQTADEIYEYENIYLNNASSYYEEEKESKIVYDKWDKLLNDIYKYLKDYLPYNDFKALENEEINWINQKENQIKNAGIGYSDSTQSNIAKNRMGIEVTRDRCYYLMSYIE